MSMILVLSLLTATSAVAADRNCNGVESVDEPFVRSTDPFCLDNEYPNTDYYLVRRTVFCM